MISPELTSTEQGQVIVAKIAALKESKSLNALEILIGEAENILFRFCFLGRHKPNFTELFKNTLSVLSGLGSGSFCKYKLSQEAKQALLDNADERPLELSRRVALLKKLLNDDNAGDKDIEYFQPLEYNVGLAPSAITFPDSQPPRGWLLENSVSTEEYKLLLLADLKAILLLLGQGESLQKTVLRLHTVHYKLSGGYFTNGDPVCKLVSDAIDAIEVDNPKLSSLIQENDTNIDSRFSIQCIYNLANLSDDMVQQISDLGKALMSGNNGAHNTRWLETDKLKELLEPKSARLFTFTENNQVRGFLLFDLMIPEVDINPPLLIFVERSETKMKAWGASEIFA